MAMTLDKFFVTFQINGVMDMKGSKEVEFLPVGADIAAQRVELDADIAEWLTNFNTTNTRPSTGVSNAWVRGYIISEKWYESTNIPAFTMDDNILVEALVGAVLEGTTDSASITIPAPTKEIFGGTYNTKTIDLEGTELELYATQYTQDTGNNAALSDGQQWQNPINLTYGRVKTRKAPSTQ